MNDRRGVPKHPSYFFWENDGAEFRKSQKITAGGGTYAYVKKQGYPLGYQTLCWNHQWKKQLTNLRINGKNRKKA